MTTIDSIHVRQRTGGVSRKISLTDITTVSAATVNRVTHDEIMLVLDAGAECMEVFELDPGFDAVAAWVGELPGVRPDWRIAIETGDLFPGPFVLFAR